MRVSTSRADGSLPIILLLLLLSARPGRQQQQSSSASHPSCEAPIDGLPPYQFGPEVLGCFGSGCMSPNIPGTAGYNPAIAPGAINATNVPYCEAACVIAASGQVGAADATPEQINMGPACRDFCATAPAAAGTVENYGWCFYWCLMGKRDVVGPMSCVDAIPYHIATLTEDGEVVTAAVLGPDTTTEGASVSSDAPVVSNDSQAPDITPSSSTVDTQAASASTYMVSITMSPSMRSTSELSDASAAAESQPAMSTSQSGGLHIELHRSNIFGLLIAGLALGFDL